MSSELWSALASGDRQARDRLVATYLPFARRQASAVFRRTGHALADWDDYVQSATIGLIEAIDRFNDSYGVPFEAFAGIRIRGAVFNSLRALSDRGGDRHKASWALRWRERTQQLAEAEGEGLDAFIEVVVGLGIGFLLEQDMESATNADPIYSVESLQLQRSVHAALSRLPERERLIVHLHYLNQTPFHAIAETLGVSKGRVSQLHHQALRRLRDRLRPAIGHHTHTSTSHTLSP